MKREEKKNHRPLSVFSFGLNMLHAVIILQVLPTCELLTTVACKTNPLTARNFDEAHDKVCVMCTATVLDCKKCKMKN